MALGVRICIDVPDLARGVAFYTEALGLTAGRRLDPHFAELLGGPAPIDLLGKAAGSAATASAEGPAARRAYKRHWTPVHLDVVVEDLDAAVERAVAAGAVVERPIAVHKWGRIAVLADPFGHGLCLLQFTGRGYDELLGTP